MTTKPPGLRAARSQRRRASATVRARSGRVERTNPATDVAATRLLLDNGLAVVLCPQQHLSQFHVAAFFGVGSRHEDQDKNGITHFLEHMLFRGSKSYPDATAINAAAEDFGGFLDGATYRDHMSLSTGGHPSAVGKAIEILAELIQSPRYRSIEVERGILREELRESLDADGRMIDVDNVAHRLTFGAHGLGQPIEGTLDILESIQRTHLEKHRQRFIVASNTVISVAGPLDVQRTVDQIEQAFGSLPSGSSPLVQAPPPPAREPILRYVRDPSSQVDIRISFRAAPVSDENYPALVMLSRLLADGLASRMHAELVDRRGLAYMLGAGLTSYVDCGLFEFDVAVAPNRAAEAISAILDFASASGRFRFTSEEMSRARRRFRYGMEFMADNPPDLASWYGRSTLFGVEDELDGLGARINKVREPAIRAAARSIFKREGLVVAAVGQLGRGQWRDVQKVVNDWGGA